ncbi:MULTISPECIES: hypothetical protein [Asaia]|uniref:Uncharacterized protein n=1 Tax=Asaia bogorensis NBRC 16594 TaxID=1231624 RepID=A0AAN4R4H5_9PROT|nr:MULTISPECIES: hypothetical protein [Asaia]NIE79686.1 hypothetical protein [Asaia sp. As-1742]BAT19317.1 hypothetical protein Asbog_01033 [Asaia bogorensis NBRC 16594]GBQ82228.1 hypothetical protein AA0311_2830 [Asaia bogorensis NBRC 16594]GEL54188.1 hypothetical protein ABO01nite_21950 [Asaia bogorensis NBRC 16594]
MASEPKTPSQPGAPRLGSGRRKPRTLKQHLLRRLIVLVPASLLAILVMKMGWLDQAADKIQFDRLAWFDNTKLVEHLRVMVTHNGMTDVPAKCLVPILNGNDPPDATRIDFMQRSNDGCPGKPGTFDRLFTIKVNRADRMLATDQGTPGRFHAMSQQ